MWNWKSAGKRLLRKKAQPELGFRLWCGFLDQWVMGTARWLEKAGDELGIPDESSNHPSVADVAPSLGCLGCPCFSA
jgi:hypothetical protein